MAQVRPAKLYASAAGEVWRVHSPTGPVVVKRTRDIRGVVHEVKAVQRLAAVAGVGFPRVIAHGVCTETGSAWVVYEDAELVPIGRCRHRYDGALAALAALHAAPWRTVKASVGSVANSFARPVNGRADIGDVAGVERAHTPDVEAVAESVRQMDRSEWLRVVRRVPVTPCIERSVLRWQTWAARRSEVFAKRVASGPKTICHGDPHLGNLMWSVRERRVHLIDWEYVHENNPYFDLFQLLDATSPTTPLVRPRSRLSALNLYLSALCRQLAGHPEKGRQYPEKGRQEALHPELSDALGVAGTSDWVRGYLRYAALHLLWILQRIDADWEAGRWQPASLTRQLQETLRGLRSLDRDFASAGGVWRRPASASGATAVNGRPLRRNSGRGSAPDQWPPA